MKKIEANFDESVGMKRITKSFIQNKPIDTSCFYKGVKIPDGFILSRIRIALKNTCAKKMDTSVEKIDILNRGGSTEFDIITYDNNNDVLFVGELKSWINLNKIKKDVYNVKKGMSHNSLGKKLYYFIGNVVIDNEIDRKEWLSFIETEGVVFYEICLRWQEINWVLNYMANIKLNDKNFKTRCKCVEIVRHSFSFILNNIQNIIRNDILRSMGLRRRALIYEELEFQKKLHGKKLTEFRETKDICRNMLLKNLKKLKKKTLNFFRYYDKSKSGDILVFLKKNIKKFILLKKAKQIVHFKNTLVVERYYEWVIDQIKTL